MHFGNFCFIYWFSVDYVNILNEQPASFCSTVCTDQWQRAGKQQTAVTADCYHPQLCSQLNLLPHLQHCGNGVDPFHRNSVVEPVICYGWQFLYHWCRCYCLTCSAVASDDLADGVLMLQIPDLYLQKISGSYCYCCYCCFAWLSCSHLLLQCLCPYHAPRIHTEASVFKLHHS